MKSILFVTFILISSGNYASALPTDPNLLRNPQLESKWLESSSSVWLFEGVDLHHGVSFNSESKTLTVSSWVSQLFITCSAHYPIYWDYDQPSGSSSIADSSVTITTTMQRVSVNFTDPSSYLYYATLQLRGDGRRITGEYSCKSTTNETLETSRFIFWEGTTRNLKLGEIKNIYSTCTSPICKDRPAQTVKADKANQTIILPCSVCNPHTKVHLSKKILQTVSTSLSYVEVKYPNESITFDPKVGFVLKVQTLPAPYGIYRCIVKCTTGYGCSDETYIVSASPDIEPDVPLVTNDILAPKAKYYFEPSTNQIICCSNGTQPPRVYGRMCQSKLDCEKAKSQVRKSEYFDRSDLRSANCRNFTVKTGESLGVFRCVGEGIDVTKEYSITNQIYTDDSKYETDEDQLSDYSGEGSGNGEGESISPSGNGNQSLTRIYYDDEILKLPKFHFIKITGGSYSYGHVIQAGTLNGNIYSYFSNANITMFCTPSPYLFTLGVRWSIGWKNGTKKLIPAADQSSVTGAMGHQGPGQGNSLNLKISDDLDNISCHAPLYNSSAWVTRTLTFNLTKTTPSIIEGPEVEYVNWTLGETNKKLSCQSTGDPTPSIIWSLPWARFEYTYTYVTRTWSKIVANYQIVGGLSTRQGHGYTEIRFKEVLEAMAGNFTCTARNMAGSATKTFIVTIGTAGTGQTSLPTTTNAPLDIPVIARRPPSDTRVLEPEPENDATEENPSIIENIVKSAQPPEPESNSSLVVALVIVSIALVAAGVGIGFLWFKNRQQQRAFAESTNHESITWNEMANASKTSYEDLS